MLCWFTSKTAHPGAPIDLRVLGERGEVPAGPLEATIDGAPIEDAGVEILSKWSDGSVCMARVVGQVKHVAGKRREISVGPASAPPEPSLFELPTAIGRELLKKLTFRVEIVDASGTHLLAVDAAQSFALLKHLVYSVPGTHRHELSGVMKPTQLGLPHPRLQIEVTFVAYSGWPGVFLEVSIENSRTDGPPQVVPILAASLSVSGGAPLQLGGSFDLHPGARFGGCAWMGRPLPEIEVELDAEALARMGVALPYDAKHPVTDAEAGVLLAALKRDNSRGPILAAGDPLLFGAPGKCGPVYRVMGGTADRPDIGHWPMWAAMTLNGGSPIAEGITRHADCNGSGSFSIHFRDAANPAVLGLKHSHPFIAKAAVPQDPAKKNPSEVNNAHQPLLGLYTWLTKGWKFALDEFVCWTLAGIRDTFPNDGSPGQNPGGRRESWVTRDMALATALLPDDHSLKGYIADSLRRTLDEWAIFPLDHPLGAYSDGDIFTSGRPTSVFTQWSSCWMSAWFTGELMLAERLLGTNDALTRMIEHNWKWWQAYVTAAGTTWVAPSGEVMTFNADDLVGYSNPVATYEPEWYQPPSGYQPFWRAKPGSVKPIDSFAALAWWVRIQSDYQVTQQSPANLPADPDPMHARPKTPDGKWARPPNLAAYHTYGLERVALQWLAQARGLPDADGVAAFLAPKTQAWAKLNHWPAGLLTVPIGPAVVAVVP